MKESHVVVKCCVCHRVRDGAHWHAENPRPTGANKVSHAYCPVCYQRAMDELDVLLGKGTSMKSFVPAH
jgi:hypothetical protein